MPIVAFCVSAMSAAGALMNCPTARANCRAAADTPCRRLAVRMLVRPVRKFGFQAENAVVEGFHRLPAAMRQACRYCSRRRPRGLQELLSRRREYSRVFRSRIRS